MKVAKYLESHPAIERVVYPGLPSHPQYELAQKQMVDADGNFAPGILLYFVLKGDAGGRTRQGRGGHQLPRVEDSLAITLAVSLGQIRTLIEHPSSMTHAPIPVEAQIEAKLDPGGIRLAFGLEEPADIIADLEKALA